MTRLFYRTVCISLLIFCVVFCINLTYSQSIDTLNSKNKSQSENQIIDFDTGLIDKTTYPPLNFLEVAKPGHVNLFAKNKVKSGEVEHLIPTNVEELLTTEHIYIFQAPVELIPQWVEILKDNMISFVPPNILLIRVDGMLLRQLQEEYDDDQIDYIQILPTKLKQSRRLQYFRDVLLRELSNEQSTGGDGNTSNQIYDNIVQSLFDQDQALQSFTLTSLLQHSRFNDHTSTQSDMTDGTTTNTNPSCLVGNDQSGDIKSVDGTSRPGMCYNNNNSTQVSPFDDLKPKELQPQNIDTAPNALEQLLTGLLQQHKLIDTYEEQLQTDPEFQNLSVNEQEIIEARLAPRIAQLKPMGGYQGLATVDPNSSLFGVMSYGYTHHISAMMTTSAKDEYLVDDKDTDSSSSRSTSSSNPTQQPIKIDVNTKFARQINKLSEKINRMHTIRVAAFVERIERSTAPDADLEVQGLELTPQEFRLVSLFNKKFNVGHQTVIPKYETLSLSEQDNTNTSQQLERINFNTFLKTLSQNLMETANTDTAQQLFNVQKTKNVEEKQRLQQQLQTSTILSILPFNSVFQSTNATTSVVTPLTNPRSKYPKYNPLATDEEIDNPQVEVIEEEEYDISYTTKTTFKHSKTPLSFLNIQLQSPLYLTSAQHQAEIMPRLVAQRVALLNEITTQQQQTLSKQGIKEILSNDSIDLHTAREKVQKSYQELLRKQKQEFREQEERIAEKIAAAKSEDDKNNILSEFQKQKSYFDSIDVENTFQSNNEVLTHLAFVQYIDTILLSLYEVQLKQIQQTQKTTNQMQQQQNDVPKLLSVDDTLILLSAYLDVQFNELSGLTTDVIEILSQDNDVHFVDLKLPIATTNRWSRFANTLNLNARWTQEPSAYVTTFGPLGPYNDAEISGRNVVVGVSDTGSDYNSCFFLHNAVSIPFLGREEALTTTSSAHIKYKCYVAYADETDVQSLRGHGTHVTGTIAGSARLINMSIRLTHQHHNGIAADSKLAFFDIGNPSGSLFLPLDLDYMFKNAAMNGGHIYSNSWGCALSMQKYPVWACNTYDESSYQIDKYLNENPGFTILMAGGNEGANAYYTIGSTAVAKNPIVVAATTAGKDSANEARTQYPLGSSYAISPSSYDQLNVITSFSSMGPTFDGRISPHISGPGQAIFSASSASSRGEKTCAVQPMAGTSMATPGVSGTLALAQQMLTEGRIAQSTEDPEAEVPPSQWGGGLLRAMAINSAEHVQYRGVHDVSDPHPFAKQSQLSATRISRSVTHTHAPIGIILRYTDIPTSSTDSKFIYVQKTGTTGQRLIRMMALINCTSVGTTPELTAAAYDESGEMVARRSFYFEQALASRRAFMDFNITTNQRYAYISLQLSQGATCPWAAIGFQEFSTLSSTDAQRFIAADCNTQVYDYPEWSLASLLAPVYTFRCPPAPLCTDSYTGQKNRVLGMNYYSVDTPVCRAALHLGAVNATNATASGDQLRWIVDNQEVLHKLNGQYVRVTPFQSTIPAIYTLPATLNNDIMSLPLRVNYKDEILTLAVVPGPDIVFHHLSKLSEGPNPVSGWGRIHLGSILPLTQFSINPDNLEDGVQRKIILFSGAGPKNGGNHFMTNKAAKSYCFRVSDKPLLDKYQYTYKDTLNSNGALSRIWSSGSDDLRVTLSWYDIPGSNIATKLLVNDLDLFLYTPDGTEYRGNQRVDRRNNIERIYLKEGQYQPGVYCAVVSGTYVPILEQEYSLVVNGRGIERCGDNPIQQKQFTPTESTTPILTLGNLSGLWSKRFTSPTCTNQKLANTYFAQLNDILIKQGGDCITISRKHPDPTPNTNYATNKKMNDTNLFNGLRLSPTIWEDQGNWDQDEKVGVAQTHSISYGNISISGTIIDENGNFMAKSYAINPATMFDFELSGYYTTTSTGQHQLRIVATHADGDCEWTYQQTQVVGPLTFDFEMPSVQLQRRPFPFSNTATSQHITTTFFMIIMTILFFTMMF